MNRRIAAVLVLSISLGVLARELDAQQATAVQPPVAPVRPVTDDYFGTKVVDNYRYFENLKDPEVQQWMKAQSDYTQAVLDRIPGRERLLERIRELDKSQKAPLMEAWWRPGNRYFYLKPAANDGVTKLYSRVGLGGVENQLVDPGTIPLAPQNQGNGPSNIQGAATSDDGRYVAVGITPGGAELNTELHVIETNSGKETGDVMLREPGGGNVQWMPDNHSFLYTRFQDLPVGAPATEVYQKQRTYLHVLGTDARRDPAVFGYGVVPSISVSPTQFSTLGTDAGSRYAVGFVNDGYSFSEVYVAPVDAIGKPGVVWRKVTAFSDQVSAAALHGDDLYLLTSKDASHHKIIRIDARNPDLAAAEVVVPATGAILGSMTMAEDALYVKELDGGISRVLRVPFGSHPRVAFVPLPFAGLALPYADPGVPGTLVFLATATTAPQLDAYDPRTNRLSDTHLEPHGTYDTPSNIKSAEVKVTSYDGTLVPLTIVYPKGITLDGSHPAVLEGYGAYGILANVVYFPRQLAVFERGVVQATCHVRGGGENGPEWHVAGKGPTKANTWRDFIACAEYLVAKGYTSPAHLAGEGASGGGIMIGRAIEERPDLFAAAVAEVPASDMLRFETTANGIPNIPEFGSTKTEEGFRALYAMSPYANVKDGVKYPAVLVTTGANDPRVDPWEPAKLAARLQAATVSGKPVLLRVDYHAGHGNASTQAQDEEEAADKWSFLLWQLGDPDFQPKELKR